MSISLHFHQQQSNASCIYICLILGKMTQLFYPEFLNGATLLLLLGNECREINLSFAISLQLQGKRHASANIHSGTG